MQQWGNRDHSGSLQASNGASEKALVKSGLGKYQINTSRVALYSEKTQILLPQHICFSYSRKDGSPVSCTSKCNFIFLKFLSVPISLKIHSRFPFNGAIKPVIQLFSNV